MVSQSLPSRYRIIEEVGQGGMAVVYRAEDRTLNREVAVKVLHPHLLAEPESKARLEREAHAVAKLNHDGILQIFDYSGGDSQSSYIVTEFIDGQTLKQFLASRRLPVPELAALIVLEVGAALAHAHSLGILHRDVKPENIMVRRDGVIKLMDFGVAQVVDLERMTVTGQILGSPAYMAPELLEGKRLDFRSDVFSVGVMLYQMATGVLPFAGKNPHEVLRRVAEGRFADPRTVNRLVSDQLARVVARALAHAPEDRYPAVAPMLDDLRTYVGDAGLGSAHDELHSYLSDPDAYEKALPARLVAALVTSGQREHTAGRCARALELWNRALALEPENATVLSELRRLEHRERVRRMAIALAAVVGLAGLVVGAVHAARAVTKPAVVATLPPPPASSMSPVPPAPKVTPPPAEPAVAVAEVAVAQPVRPREVHRDTRKPIAERPSRDEVVTEESRPAVRPAHAIPTVLLTLGPNPAKVEVWMDGQKRFDFGPQQNRIEIPWDEPHKLEFRNDRCCNPKEVVVGPQVFRPPGDHLFVNLDPKPARLTISLQPPKQGANILIRQVGDGIANPWRTSARPGEKVPVPFDAGEEMRKSLEVVVFLGEKTVVEPVTLTAGETRQVSVRLDE
jgi:serine/threonine-protein kinase